MQDQAVLRRIDDRKAIILAEGTDAAKTYVAYPYGDRRRRPVSWIDRKTLNRMLADGVIEQTPKGYEIVSSARRRAKSKHAASAHAGQHRDMHSELVSHKDGSFRSAQVNRNSKSVLRRLSQSLDSRGEAFLCAAEIEAGERLGRDYARSGLTLSITQKYDNVGAGSSFANSHEDGCIGALDARKRVLDALAFVGPGLDKAVSAICCRDAGLEELELAQGWAKRSGKTVLKLGLGRLAEFYGTATG